MNIKNSYEELAIRLCEGFFKRQSASLLTNVEKKNVDQLDVTRERILDSIKEELADYVNDDGECLTDEEKEIVIELVRRNMWGYGTIDDLIHRKDISDIKLYGPDNIRIKAYGKRTGSEITFSEGLSSKVCKFFFTPLSAA